MSLMAAIIANALAGGFGSNSTSASGSGGGLPVVELAFVSTDEVTELNAEGAAMMDALNGGLCVMKILELNSGTSITIIPSIITEANSPIYVASIMNMEFAVSKNDNGVWLLFLSPAS